MNRNARPALLLMTGLLAAAAVAPGAPTALAAPPAQAPAPRRDAPRTGPTQNTTDASSWTSGWEIGFKGGVTGSTLAISPTGLAGQSSVIGFTFGVDAEIPLSGDIFFLQPGIRWAQRGLSFTGTTLGIAYTANYRINEIEIPILAEAKFLPKSSVKPYVLLGPNFGFKMNTNVTATQTGTNSSVTLDPTTASLIDSQLQLQSMDVAVTMAGGLEFQLSSSLSITAEARFDLGLLNQTGSIGSTAYHRSFQGLAGLNYAL